MDQKRSGPTIMRGFSIWSLATGDKLSSPELEGVSGLNAVLHVEWSEIPGDLEISKSERWYRLSANIWRATPQKK